MTKRLNADQIAHELEGSAFFPSRQPSPPSPSSSGAEHVPAAPVPGDVMTSQRQNVMASKRHDVKTSQRRPTLSTAPPPAKQSVLSLTETPYRDFTLRVTEAEYEALDDLERELRRQFGIVTSKNTLIRCGLHHIVHDHATTKDQSIVVRTHQKKPATS